MNAHTSSGPGDECAVLTDEWAHLSLVTRMSGFIHATSAGDLDDLFGIGAAIGTEGGIDKEKARCSNRVNMRIHPLESG